ncbi:MAG TPA: phosphoadenylyl-sulfate reductase [Thermodesulfobacteriota bacterium]|nr:phosphoadenylyl-sulfate reductase [Thermodesulfobacteriota bacterium]
MTLAPATDAARRPAGPLPDAEGWDAQAVLRWALDRFGDRVALASSFGAEDVVLIDMLAKLTPRPRVFTLDTGRLPQETYDVIQAVRDRYGIAVEIFFPDAAAVEAMVREKGPNLFYESIEARKRCCHVRKVEPLGRALAGLDAWVTGLRREQSVTRTATPKLELEPSGRVKIAPLADWTREQVWAYIREHRVPYNALHDRGYPSIGCAPCTRPVAPGEDERAGRWWWERPETKECGLHAPRAGGGPGGR